MTARTFFIAFLAGSLLFACKKSSCDNNKDIKGKWTLIETHFDPGDGSVTWKPATVYGLPSNIHVEFLPDGTMHGDPSYFSTLTGIIQHQIQRFI